ncbi:response regulator transcription factor [Aestuariicoccus sp. MJ-SS9]|uniref:response regulator transcription factor n=1 Tax=Aestuariicoccus sp. MJ-SS9 TaxID=3079855 RepID=UPI0029084600|nr:response regulator [Aestuariicoccus sp. MJ-SS9]MDU8910212.1 response regulator [Aestuariicoccus sp. MJ-SS9]
MNVLIVESCADLATLWSRHLMRQGATVEIADHQEAALEMLESRSFDIIVLDLVLRDGGALALADFASYRWPNTRVIFVTNTHFFSDGSIFTHCANACAYLAVDTAPEDIAAMVEHYGRPV